MSAPATTPPATPWRSRSTVVRLAVAVVSGLLVALIAPAALVEAHEGIAGSDPESGSRLDEPISSVTIDFGEEIADDLEMALLYDTGDAEIEEVDSSSSRSAPTIGRVEFAPLEREGRYFVRYLATVPSDGHVVAGSISFDYGDPRGSSSDSVTPWILFGVAAVVILGIGAWFSRRRHLQLVAAASEPGPDADSLDEPHGDPGAGGDLSIDGSR